MKVAFIGAGFIAAEHLRGYKRLQQEGRDIEICAICDKSPATRERYAGVYPVCEDAEEMLSRERPDIVDICAPTFLHRSLSELAFSYGANVLSEKPMALTVSDCAAMIEASEKAGKLLMIAHPMRFYKPYDVIEQYIREKPFGEPRSAFFHRCDGRPARPGNWILKDALSGGVTLDLAIHDADAARMFFGDPASVSAAAIRSDDIDIYDSASYNLQYPRMYVNLYNEWSVENNLHMVRFFRVNFETGYLIFDGSDMVVRAVSNGHEAAVYDCKGDDCYYNEIAYFTACVRDGKPVDRCRPQESMKSIELCRRCMAEIRN
ncbi:MAG: Gfo/Idh/MocA family oxidoreductase [Eubacteriales bacterium]|nr:Gfo/Idh/MocA family oxidoreductase [Eubacteriales bacterium]MDY5015895.1 Gfo/Idh/MocA family oxidoreductase [Eubacteriales bacterium]